MAYDLEGQNGTWFSVTTSAWCTLAALIEATGVLSEEELEAIQYNDGHVVPTDKALRIANAIAPVVDTLPDRLVLEPAEPPIEVLGVTFRAGGPFVGLSSVAKDTVSKFVTFCRDAGGFNVW